MKRVKGVKRVGCSANAANAGTRVAAGAAESLSRTSSIMCSQQLPLLRLLSTLSNECTRGDQEAEITTVRYVGR